MRRRRPGIAAAALALLCFGLSACGGTGAESTTVAEQSSQPGAGGALDWILTDKVDLVDPLYATSYPNDLVSAQSFEPLSLGLRGPQSLGGERLAGLAELVPNDDGSVWRLNLRSGVRFHDGEPLDADAVLENFERWRLLPPGRRLLPPIQSVTAVSLLSVRINLRQPNNDLDEVLASPRLGVVSPLAFNTDSPAGARVENPVMAGSGPFRMMPPGQSSLSLLSNPTWWATEFGAGPALTRITFAWIASNEDRYGALESGEAQVADGPFARRISDHPLLVTRELANGQQLGVERSVRGLSSSRYPPMLSRVWLTDLAS